MPIINENGLFGEFDPSIYGGGDTVEISGGAADGTLFFIAENTVLAAEYDAVISRPITLGEEPDPKVHLFLTIKGKMNNEDRMGAATVVMSLEMTMSLIKDLRKLVQEVPMHLRTVD